MKKLNKKLAAGTGLGILTIGVLVPLAISMPASAYSGSGSSSIIDQLVSRFSLNEDEVQEVFDANRTERTAEKQANQEDKLATAVADGDLTQEQSDLITAKLTETKDDFVDDNENLSDKTTEERKELMEARKAEIEAWAEENGIDSSYLMMKNSSRQGRRNMQ